MSSRLAAAVRALQWAPMDDIVCEGPHAVAKRVKTPASSAKWTWVATSMRLGQNIADCRSFPQELGASLRPAWSAFSTIVQPASKSHRVPRMTTFEFQRRMYRLDHLLAFRIVEESRPPALEDSALAADSAPGALERGSDSDEEVAGGDSDFMEDAQAEVHSVDRFWGPALVSQAFADPLSMKPTAAIACPMVGTPRLDNLDSSQSNSILTWTSFYRF